MNIQVSKVFAKFINNTAKEMGFDAEAEVVEMSSMMYQWNVGDTYDGQRGGDYNWETGKFKVIKVTYPYDFFANPLYLTTVRLTSECRRRGVKSLSDLREMLKDMIEI